MSVDLERNDKQGKLAVVTGGLMTIVFLVAAIVVWSLPTVTENRISGEQVGLPFTGTGACFLSMAGLLIAGIGALALRRGRHHRVPGPTIHGPPPPPHRNPTG